MSSRQITVADVLKAINSENIEKPAGRLDSNTRELELQMTSKLSEVAEFENIVLRISDGSKIRLSDIARVTVGAETDRGFLRANGKNAIGLGIVRQTKSNVLKVTDVKKKLRK